MNSDPSSLDLCHSSRPLWRFYHTAHQLYISVNPGNCHYMEGEHLFQWGHLANVSNYLRIANRDFSTLLGENLLKLGKKCHFCITLHQMFVIIYTMSLKEWWFFLVIKAFKKFSRLVPFSETLHVIFIFLTLAICHFKQQFGVIFIISSRKLIMIRSFS